MKVTTGKGWLFDTKGGAAESVTRYAHNEGLENFTVVLATAPDGEYQEYVILRDNVPIKSSQKYEDIYFWIGIASAFDGKN